ncbi:hypothetical protein RRG08_050881 [Elysia crispata]|uniref:DUF19 domain-containing protein n=1 Tax=Elysia crispata TaxID=231223 RepID=A0AAE0ZDA5_9GAST|nr:hypothetical protein RRG08_050881 [Elysia crispata]
MTWKLLIVLTCLPVASESTMSSGCAAMRQCETSIRDEKIFAHQESLLIKVKDEQTLGRVCRKVPTTINCIDQNVQHCKENYLSKDTKLFKDIVQFICTPEGRQVAMDAGKTSCVVDRSLEMRFQFKQLGCVKGYFSGIDAEEARLGRKLEYHEACKFRTKVDECVKSGMETMCGKEMAIYVEKMWELWNKHGFPEDKC